MEKDMKKSFFLRNEENQAQQNQAPQNSGVSVISAPLLNAIQSKREPSLFDTEEVTERNRGLLQELEKTDAMFNLRRNNKPVFLRNAEAKLLFALAFGIGFDKEREDIQRIIKDPFSEEKIVREINITELSKLMNNGSSRRRERKEIFDSFYRLHSIFHVIPYHYTDKEGNKIEVNKIQPLIHIEGGYEGNIKDKEGNIVGNLDSIRVSFCRAFFINLTTRFAPLPEIVFEIWSEFKRGELFHVLLSTLLYSHTWCYITAEKTEERVTKENNKKDRNLRLKGEELRAKIREEQAQAWKYSLKYSSIKERVARDYSSTRFYKHLFKKDLDKTIEGLMKLGLVKEYVTTDKDKPDPKVIFLLNENFNKQGLLEAPTPEEKNFPEDSGK